MHQAPRAVAEGAIDIDEARAWFARAQSAAENSDSAEVDRALAWVDRYDATGAWARLATVRMLLGQNRMQEARAAASHAGASVLGDAEAALVAIDLWGQLGLDVGPLLSAARAADLNTSKPCEFVSAMPRTHVTDPDTLTAAADCASHSR